jgi:membrane peptidoglycan carboxypeptidase
MSKREARTLFSRISGAPLRHELLLRQSSARSSTSRSVACELLHPKNVGLAVEGNSARPAVSDVISGLAGGTFFSIVAAVLVVVMMVPGLGMVSTAANASIGIFNDLPSYIALGKLSQANTVYATRAGTAVPIATIYNQDRQDVAWTGVSQYLKDAAVAGEDRRFYQHGGVDMPSIARAAIENTVRGAITSGSSTLDMQLVKNILVQQALQISNATLRKVAYQQAITDTMSRKIREMKLSIGLDKKYSKQEILLGYLNITGFGGNTYGVQAAAQQYFSVDATQVTVAQAASLVAIVQQPSFQNLASPKEYPANKLRRDQILNDMYQQKFISKSQFDTAIGTPIASEVKLSSVHSGCLYASDAKWACDYVQHLVPSLNALGTSAADRTRRWERGGYKVYTSIDLAQQDVTRTALRADAPATESRFALGASAVSIQPGTGRILVMTQNKAFDNSGPGGGPTTTAINYNTDQNYGGSSGFQTGSTYKIFTLADWLQNGHGLNDVVNGTSRTFQQSSFAAPCSKPFVGTYSPKNDSAGEGGLMSVITATQNSVNAAFMTMAQQLNLCDIRTVAQSMGVHRADGTPLRVDPASVLGVNDIAPITMAGAIATIGAAGTYCAPLIVDKIIDPVGKSLTGQPQQCTQALAPNIASTVAYALAAVMKRGTGTAGNPQDGVPIVGKTGTTDVADQNWLIATTTKVSLAVWVGNSTGHQSLRQISIAGTNGYNTKFNIFRTAMKSLDSDPKYRGAAFPAPDASLIREPGIRVPTLTGQSVSSAQSALSSLGFSVTNGGTQASDLPVGEVSGTSPPAGSVAGNGSQVSVFTSDGSLPIAMPNEVGKSRQAAVADLQSAGFAASHITYVWVASPPGNMCTVTQMSPTPSSSTSRETPIRLTVSDGTSSDGVDPGIACP